MKDLPLFVSVKEDCVPDQLKGDIKKMKNLQSCRIPTLITSDEIVIAGCDRAVYGGDWGFIEIAVRRSSDSGDSFDDMQVVYTPPVHIAPADLHDDTSAFAIDPVTVKAPDGTLLMLFDFYPESKGIFKREILKNSNGYVYLENKYFLRLTDRDGNEYTVRENGIVYDNMGRRTKYYLPQKHSSECNYQTVGDLYYSDGAYQYIGVCPPLIPDNTEDKYVGNIYLRRREGDVEGVVFKKYSETVDYECLETMPAPLTADITSYIWMIKSNDNGKTWSQPEDITPYVKRNDDDVFLGVTPGNGLCLTCGRILIPVYSVGTAYIIYSDDNGVTWHRGNECANIDECQLVQFSDGVVGCFGRPEKSGDMPYSLSYDNGITWHKKANSLYTVKCQHSCLTVPKNIYTPEINGNKDYIICTRPTGHHGEDETRTAGCAALGEINSDGTVNWIKELKIKTDPIYECSKEYADFFAYSCMTVLPDGMIGILYEPFPSGYIAFKKFSLTDFT